MAREKYANGGTSWRFKLKRNAVSRFRIGKKTVAIGYARKRKHLLTRKANLQANLITL
jgi:hypothetical protein